MEQDNKPTTEAIQVELTFDGVGSTTIYVKSVEDYAQIGDHVQEFMGKVIIKRTFIGILIGLFLGWGIAKADTPSVKQRIIKTAIKYNEDPTLMLAIAHTESNLNPKAVGSVGELGLFQMRPKYFNIKHTDTVETQTIKAIYLLKELKKACGTKFLQCYNMGPAKTKKKMFKTTSYERKVLNAYKNFNLSVAGNISPDKGQNYKRQSASEEVSKGYQGRGSDRGLLRPRDGHNFCLTGLVGGQKDMDIFSRTRSLHGRHNTEI
jgi:hypothetical protein